MLHNSWVVWRFASLIGHMVVCADWPSDVWSVCGTINNIQIWMNIHPT